jgi:CRP-like cAMP-binding protein
MMPKTTVIKPGTHLFHENDRSRELYIIQSGNVRVYKALNGREIELAILGKGAVLGEMALIDGRPRSASAVALDICVAVVVDAEAFHSRVTNVPPWLMTIVKMTSSKIRNAERLLQSIGGSQRGINIVIALNYLFARHGKEIEPAFARETLGRLLKASDDSITRVFEFLGSHSFIHISETCITLPDPLRMAEYCDFLRFYVRKTFERGPAPSQKVQAFMITAAQEFPELVAADDTRKEIAEIKAEDLERLFEKSGLADSRMEILADCAEQSLGTAVKAAEKEKEGFSIPTQLWRQWYLFFTFNGVIPCM